MARKRAIRSEPSDGAGPRVKTGNGTVGHSARSDNIEGLSIVDDFPDVIPVCDGEAKAVELYLGRLIDDLMRELDHS